MKIEFHHHLPIEIVKEKLQDFETQIRQNYSSYFSEAKVNWSDYQADIFVNAKGFKVKGQIEILPDKILIDLSLPISLMPFKGQIKELILQTLKDLLNV